MYTFLLVVHALVAALLVTVILMQRSEGGGLTTGNAGGLMSARGAADFLTRATSILATIFIVMSIALAALATIQGGSRKVDTSLAKGAAPTAPASPQKPTNSPVPLAH